MSDLLKEFDPLSQDSNTQEIPEPNTNTTENSKSNTNDNDNNSITSETKSSLTKKPDDRQDEYFFDFQVFINDFKEPNAEPLVKYTRSFLNNFVTQKALWTASEQQKLINDFKLFIFEKFNQFKPFNEFNKVKLRNSQEGIEKLIMGKLYPLCFSPELLRKMPIDKLDEEHKNDILEDGFLQEKIDEYAFIELDNLDVNKKISLKLGKFLKLAGKELNKINQFKAPRDKMVCILNTCKIIFSILKHSKLEQDGADSFIPLLIYVIIHGNIQHLISNIRFIERFRYERFLKSEDQYYLSSLQGATNFIANLSKKDLAISNDEVYEKTYNDNQIRVNEKKKQEIELGKKGNVQNEDIAITNDQEYSYNPIDEIASSMVSMFNDFFIGQPATTTKIEPQGKPTLTTVATETSTSMPPNTNISSESMTNDRKIRKAVKKMEEQEQQETLEALYDMFPDLPRELIEDICIAKKYRTGVCVDTLLNLYE